MRELDGMRIIGSADGERSEGASSIRREIVSAADTGGRWRFGEVTADPDERVGTHLHPGEPEMIMVIEGAVELHGAHGIAHLTPGDAVFIPPDTEHGLRAPTGGRWVAIWPIQDRLPGKRYAG